MSIHRAKLNAANAAAKYIQDGMIVGLGSGSTVFYLLEEIGNRVKKGLHIQGVVSSKETLKLARKYQIPVIDLDADIQLDINIDGADEVDPDFNLIKGGGKALLREKINAYFAKKNIIIVDATKQVSSLGKFPLPIEVTRYAYQKILATIKQRFHINAALRRGLSGELFVTDNQNHIIDAKFNEITSPEKLSETLINIPGVIETGIFTSMCDMLIVGYENDVKIIGPK